MSRRLLLLICLLIAKTFEVQDIFPLTALKNQDSCTETHQHNNRAYSNKGTPENKYLHSKNAIVTGIMQSIFSEAKGLRRLATTAIFSFFEFFNSSVGLKNVALEHPSSPLMLVADKSSVMLDLCISHQESESPFHLQSGSICMANLSLTPQMNVNPSSLVFSSDDSNIAILRNSIVTDLAVSSSDYFLLSGNSKSEEISNCAFRNMSVKYTTNGDNFVDHSCLLSSMENCLIYSCVNAFEGGISSGSLSSEKFVCKNTTTLFGKRGKNALQKKEQMDTTESQSFSLCEWEDCTAPQGGALYVHDNENALLTIENSSFARCYASLTRGGGIYALKVAECIVQHTTFDQCSAAATSDYGGGGITAESIYVQLMVEDCSFHSCFSGNDGGAIELSWSKTEKQKKCIINSNFDNCRCNVSSSGIGGAIEHWDPTDKVIISNCLFRNCYSMCGGGAIGLLVNSINNGTLLCYCFFHNNTCQKGGHDIVLIDSTSNNIDSTCFSTRQTENRVSTHYYSVIDKSEWLRNDFGKVRFVSSVQTEPNAIDTYSCGLHKNLPCCTIRHCLTQLIPEFVTDIEILTGTITETKSVDCNINSFTIYGQSDLSSTVQIELEAAGLSLFSVSTGTLAARDFVLVCDCAYENNRGSRLFEITGTGEMHISRLNISTGSGQTSETAFSTELINVQNGVFQMEHVNWAKTISTTSLFSLSSTNEISLTLSECTFDGIERTTSGAAVISFSNDKANMNLDSCSFSGCGSTNSENGGSMMLCVGNENEVKVKGGSFDGCFCSETDGFGGGILLQLLTDNPDFLISSSFGINTAKWGNNIFVISPDLEAIANPQKISCVSASLDTFDKVRGYDNGNTSVAIPLCIYLLPDPTEIYVSNTEASDHSHCGIAQFPCLTIKHSLARQTGEKKIIVSGMILVSEEMTFAESGCVIEGSDENSGWSVNADGDISNNPMLCAHGDAALSNLIFSLPPSLSTCFSFLSSDRFLRIVSCSLSLQDPSADLNLLFLFVESGTLTIDTFSAFPFNINGRPFISLSGSSTEAKLKNVYLIEIETSCTSGLFEVVEKASIQMSDCEISSIAPSEGITSTRLISSTSAKKIKIIRTDISNFAVKDQNGGAIECTVESGCSFVFEEGSMSSCKSEGGSGGGLWVQMKSGSSLSIGNVTESLSNNDNGNEEEKKVCFSHCSATANVDGRKGLGGGIYLYLDAGASDFILKSVRFDGCSGRKGKDLFLDANDLRAVTNTATICFNVDVNDLHKLNGFERSTANEEFVIPLVAYFWSNFTSPCHVGGQKAHDFSGCGFEQVPCCTITQAADLRFSGKNKSIKLHSPFSFVEELKIDSNEWSVTGEGNSSNYEIEAEISGSQSGVFKTH
ncbi:uncharacterized protein MONOS_10988 [Monocercomonoides exilis]|uniref:uncharacterized protein n=1 Tax=Monocercomonoides exilis TaxID=2049356 RepID=UPI003559E6B1|nr:hypothetical protein MONOS_10988 [Monocercomonoides exilis]|eukprot:MONOS_10988.1-p1 / transcript=MONOS_10988.1 / gene=MONOS_10988 / organism=Monocercomonoides_exilis_PA203 / gene_product=unspecified product / transcript_product=unspecified product / location=Mono_scaffold00525:34863-38978(-) / protein_length=1372 / sequence_SO=supercontig / SO=protein_coding / is_pseudo=false